MIDTLRAEARGFVASTHPGRKHRVTVTSRAPFTATLWVADARGALVVRMARDGQTRDDAADRLIAAMAAARLVRAASVTLESVVQAFFRPPPTREPPPPPPPPPPPAAKPRPEVLLRLLGMEPHAPYTRDSLQRAWRKVAMTAHPDRGGSQQAFVAARSAYEALAELGGFKP